MSEYNKEDYQNMMPDYNSQEEQNYYQNIMLRIGFGRRLGAWLIDFVSLSALIAVLIMALEYSGYFASHGVSISELASSADFMKNLEKITLFSMTLMPFTVMLNLIYYSTEIFLGASLGKILLGIKIASDTRYEANIQTLLIRFVTKQSSTVMNLLTLLTTIQLFQTIGGLFGIVIFLGSFAVLAEQKKALHDYIAKTAVYFKEEIVPLDYTEQHNSEFKNEGFNG
jgi:uncharacterized RDD family membrane protein YckC